MDIGTTYIEDLKARLKGLRRNAERAAAQVDDRGFFAAPDAETNSIAINMKHVGGNLRSRFTDFLTSDGEKPDRDRDGEFVITESDTRADVEAGWARGWDILENTLASLTADDLLRPIHIRDERMTALSALNRAVAHLAGHVGQIAPGQALRRPRVADAQHPPRPVEDVPAVAVVLPRTNGPARSTSAPVRFRPRGTAASPRCGRFCGSAVQPSF